MDQVRKDKALIELNVVRDVKGWAGGCLSSLQPPVLNTFLDILQIFGLVAGFSVCWGSAVRAGQTQGSLQSLGQPKRFVSPVARFAKPLGKGCPPIFVPRRPRGIRRVCSAAESPSGMGSNRCYGPAQPRAPWAAGTAGVPVEPGEHLSTGGCWSGHLRCREKLRH